MSLFKQRGPFVSHSRRKRIPVNLIAGPLGVGKTTTVNHLLRHRPESETWAVLVNEYGLIGLDAALLEKDAASGGRPGVEIREVAGGCICCSAGFLFEMSLVLLLQRRPDRLLIEPTGLAALSGILDTLDRDGIRQSVDVRSVICLLDPGRLEDTLLREEARNQIDAADILLASRSDLATADQLDAFEAWAAALFPQKRLVGRLTHGELSPSLLDTVSERGGRVRRGGHPHLISKPGSEHHAHAHDHHSGASRGGEVCDEEHPIVRRAHLEPPASTLGWICWAGLLFDMDRASSWLRQLAHLPGARRVKAVLRTNEGWWGFNFADSVEEVSPSGYRRDSRVEVILEGAQAPDLEALENDLCACLVSPPTTSSS